MKSALRPSSLRAFNYKDIHPARLATSFGPEAAANLRLNPFYLWHDQIDIMDNRHFVPPTKLINLKLTVHRGICQASKNKLKGTCTFEYLMI